MAELLTSFVLLIVFICQANGDSAYMKINIQNSTRITSPRFPEKYPPNTTVEWELSDVDLIGKWKLIFIDKLKLESSKNCQKDYLEIMEEDDTEKLCGQISMLPRLSKGPKLNIKFRSDGYNQDFGFQMEVVHIMDKDAREQLKGKGDGVKGMTAHVLHSDEKHSPMFIALVVVLAVAVLVFVSLLICLAIGIHHKRRRQAMTNPQSVIKQVQFTNPPTTVQAKRYTRPSLTETPLTSKSKSSRGILLSDGSIRYV